MSEESQPLTAEQVENWRKVLVGIFGVYALIMPAEDIQRFRDVMQERLNKDEY